MNIYQISKPKFRKNRKSSKIRINLSKIDFSSPNEKNEKNLPIFRVNIFLFVIIIGSDFKVSNENLQKIPLCVVLAYFSSTKNDTQSGTNYFQN